MSKISIAYDDIDDPRQLNACVRLKKAVAEMDYFLAIFETSPSEKVYVPVIYVYCEKLAGFYRVKSEDGVIRIRKLAITLDHLQDLLHRYHRFFIQFDPVNYRSFELAQQEQLEEVWIELFSTFIPPYDFDVQSAKVTNILITVEGIEGIGFPLDLGMIFDLRYHFMNIASNSRYYVMSVAGLSLSRFAENIVGIHLPEYTNTQLLFGFEEYYSPEALSGMPDEIRILAMRRKELYRQMLTNAQMAGVTLVYLEQPEDFLKHFESTEKGKHLQVVTHFMKNTDFPGRLRFKHSELRIDLLEMELNALKQDGRLRNDMAIEMLTCTNFYDFKQFYQFGIKYMFLSHHDYDTDQIAFYLNELYTGCNAVKLGWNTNYMDGNHHVHEARSDVYRCFFRLGFKQCAITLDQKQYI